MKLSGYEFWHSIGSPRYVVAPMVDQSELPFRLLCQRYGATAAYSPMLHSKLFLKDPKFRDRFFTTCPEDRPLFVQFCGNDPDTLLAAARLVEHRCDAVDINFGCPQHIAKRGHYGSFLMEDLDLVRRLVHTLHTELEHVPVMCKIRIFPEREHTLAYAEMLQEAGCQVLGVHGRTRDQKGHRMGAADWDVIREIKSRLHIPVIANGNISCWEDVQRCIEFTGVDAVMSADGLLHNPALFVRSLGARGEELERQWSSAAADNDDNDDNDGNGGMTRSMQLAMEYLELCRTYPTMAACMRGHLFKLLGPELNRHPDLREELGARAHTVDEFVSVVERLRVELTAAEENNEGATKTLNNDTKEEPEESEDVYESGVGAERLFGEI